MKVYRPNDAGFKAMAVGPEIRAAVLAVAEKAKTIAETLAQDFRITGDYASSFEVDTADVEVTTARWGPTTRAAGILRNTSGHAAAVEWGNAHAHTNHRVLGRTLDQLRE